MSSYTGLSEELWDKHKDTIIGLYLRPEAKLSDVITAMLTHHEFLATKSQYEAHFKKWKIRKNLSKTEWRSLSCILGKRKSGGKASEVYLNDRPVPAKKIRREEQRYSLKLCDEDTSDGGAHRVPDGIKIITPVQTPLSTELDVVDDNTDPVYTHPEQLANSGSEIPFKSSMGRINAAIQQIDDSNYGIISDYVHDDSQINYSPLRLTNASRTTDQYPSIVDTFQDHIDPQLNSFLQGTSSSALDLCPAGYNPITNWATANAGENRATSISQLSIETQKYIRCRSALLPIRGIGFSFLNILRFSVLNNSAGLGQQLVTRGLESTSIDLFLSFPQSSLATEWLVENLIRQAIEIGGLNMISKLNALSRSFLDPNTFVCTFAGRWYTPLERASIMFHVELVEALIHAKADPNKSYTGTGPLKMALSSILDAAQYRKSKSWKSNHSYRREPFKEESLQKEQLPKRLKSTRKITKLLLDAGSNVTPDIFSDALRLGDVPTLCLIAMSGGWSSIGLTALEPGPSSPELIEDLISDKLITNSMLRRFSPEDMYGIWARILCNHANRSLIMVTLKSMKQNFLLQELKSKDGQPILQLLLSSAIYYESNDVIQHCIESGVTFQSIDLVLALSKGKIELANSIIKLGVDVDVCFKKPLFQEKSDIHSISQKKRTAELERSDLLNNSAILDEIKFATPLSEALCLGDAGNEICETLKKKGGLYSAMSNVNIFEAILAAATISGNFSMVKLVLNTFMTTEYKLQLGERYRYLKAANRCLALAIDTCQSELQWHFLSSGFGVDSEAGIDSGVLLAALQKRELELVHHIMSLGTLSDLSSARFILPAVMWGDFSLMRELVGRGLHLDNHLELFPWSDVFMNHDQNYPLVELLISLGAPTNGGCYRDRGFGGTTALNSAARMAKSGMVKCLLELGVDPCDSEALCHATERCEDTVPLLLAAFKQCYPKGHHSYGCQALKHAILTENLYLVDKLSSVVNVNVEYHRESHLDKQRQRRNILGTVIDADIRAKRDIFRVLLNAGADPNLVAGHRIALSLRREIFFPETAFMAAIRIKDLQTMSLFVQHGAQINRSADLGLTYTPLQYAADLGHTDIIEWLIQNGANVNAEAGVSYGGTALQLASNRGFSSIVNVLLYFQADVNARPSRFHGGTALQLASQSGHLEIVKVLLEAGADVNAPGSEFYGKTALQFAAEEGWYGIAEILLSYGANINAVSSKFVFRTALQLAVEKGRFSMVELLIKRGAKSDSGQILKAIELAKQEQHTTIVKYLKKIHEREHQSIQTVV